MLTVPNLKPGQTPYDPSTNTITQPLDHSLPLPTTPQPNPTTTIDTLTHSLIKDAVTTLHQEDDANYAKLQQYTAHQLTTLLEDHNTFLTNQKNKYKNQFPTEQQKQLFLTITTPYFTWSQTRATTLYHQKIQEYQTTVIEKQNAELLSRALSPELAFDTQTQSTYRDMILFNLENLLSHLPKKEQQTRLTQATQTFYQKVIEKRLELDPAHTYLILASPTIQKTLTPSQIAEYKTMAANATRQDAHKTTAQTWLDDNLTPTQVKQHLSQSTIPPEFKKELHTIYTQLLHNQNRKKALTLILNAMNVHSLVTGNGATPELIPAWVTRTDPALHNHILHELATRSQTGGLPPPPDYALLLTLTTPYDDKKVTQQLADETTFYPLIQKLGGLASDAFALLLRFITQTVTQDDATFLASLRQAQQHLVATLGEKEATFRLPDYLTRFADILRLHAANNKDKIMNELEIQDILTKMPLPPPEEPNE